MQKTLKDLNTSYSNMKSNTNCRNGSNELIIQLCSSSYWLEKIIVIFTALRGSFSADWMQGLYFTDVLEDAGKSSIYHAWLIWGLTAGNGTYSLTLMNARRDCSKHAWLQKIYIQTKWLYKNVVLYILQEDDSHWWLSFIAGTYSLAISEFCWQGLWSDCWDEPERAQQRHVCGLCWY